MIEQPKVLPVTPTDFAERRADNITAAVKVTKLTLNSRKLSHKTRRSLVTKVMQEMRRMRA